MKKPTAKTNSEPSLTSPFKLPSLNLKDYSLDSIVVFIILVLGLIIGVFLVKQQQELRGKASATDVDLTLIPQTLSIQPNQEFTLNVYMDTQQRAVTSSQLQVNFNSNLFDFISLELGDTLDKVIVDGAAFGDSAYITLGVSPTLVGPNEYEIYPFTGTGNLAILTLKAKTSETTTQVSLEPGNTSGTTPTGTVITEINSNINVAGDLNPSSVTIGYPTYTPTPDPTTTPQPTPTFTPRPTSTPGPTSTPTPRPTATPQPTPTFTPRPTGTPIPTSTPLPTATPRPTTTPSPLPGDINQDNTVNSLDYVILFENFRKSPPDDPRADINGDGTVNSLDYVILFENFGKSL